MSTQGNGEGSREGATCCWSVTWHTSVGAILVLGAFSSSLRLCSRAGDLQGGDLLPPRVRQDQRFAVVVHHLLFSQRVVLWRG